MDWSRRCPADQAHSNSLARAKAHLAQVGQAHVSELKLIWVVQALSKWPYTCKPASSATDLNHEPNLGNVLSYLLFPKPTSYFQEFKRHTRELDVISTYHSEVMVTVLQN
jgi:hypothetical protein